MCGAPRIATPTGWSAQGHELPGRQVDRLTGAYRLERGRARSAARPCASQAGTGDGATGSDRVDERARSRRRTALTQSGSNHSVPLPRMQDRLRSGRSPRSAGPRCRRSRRQLEPVGRRMCPARLDARDRAVGVAHGGEGVRRRARRRCRPPRSARARLGCRSPNGRSRSCAPLGRAGVRPDSSGSASQPASLQPGRAAGDEWVIMPHLAHGARVDQALAARWSGSNRRHVADHQEPSRAAAAATIRRASSRVRRGASRRRTCEPRLQSGHGQCGVVSGAECTR